MKKTAKTFLLLTVLLTVCLYAGHIRPAFAVEKNFGTCPVMEGEPAKERIFADYEGKRYHFCCKRCLAKFKKNPSKYV